MYVIEKASLKVRRAIVDANIEDIGYANGVLFLLDRINSAVRLYTRDGKYLKQYRLYSKLVPQINDSTIANPRRSRFVYPFLDYTVCINFSNFLFSYSMD